VRSVWTRTSVESTLKRRQASRARKVDQPMATTSLLVIGAGPYALSTAAHAAEHGIRTVVVGRPMGFWREHMPMGMFLRSGPDWHLDASAVHTFEAYL